MGWLSVRLRGGERDGGDAERLSRETERDRMRGGRKREMGESELERWVVSPSNDLDHGEEKPM